MRYMIPIAIKKPYREELVQEIKDVGQELIDRADELVPKDLRLITGFSICIDFTQGDCVLIPDIICEYGTFCSNSRKRFCEED